MAKASSRIPTFRSNVPQIKPKSASEVTTKDIGRYVRAVDKEGILRYVGNVHFSKGVWCGVELSTSEGKNDGVVNGVRYFACSQSCGLMVPISKISLIQDGYDCIEDAVSGPYSMLFIDQKLPISEETHVNAYQNTELDKDGLRRHTHNKTLFDPARISKQFESCRSENFDNEKGNENVANEPVVDVKRRRTYTLEETAASICCKSLLNDVAEKPSSLPQLRNCNNQTFDYTDSPLSSSSFNRGEFEEFLLRKLQLNSTILDEDSSKRDSLEFEESLGILTPEQMLINSRTPSSECIVMLPINEDKIDNLRTSHKSELASPVEEAATNLPKKGDCALDLPSPNIVDASCTDFSFGILSNLTLKTDTTMNMELPLDTVDRSKEFTLTRLEQTPSPEDLPLDPTPIIESDPKTDQSKSKTTSSFITSITSITSLDTGYQGDGEMSRPASRGADNSPLTRRPLPRPQTRRPDPMTDSDFYTESDADNHDENPLRGDRRAQVIDGTLYGVDPQAAADIYVNNRENMDSSGIFTDLESNNRTEEDSRPNIPPDASPSDTSSKTISGNSQNHFQEILVKASVYEEKVDSENVAIKENPKKRNAPSPVVSSPSSVRSPRHSSKDESAAKKYKMPKREVTSKVKAMLVATPVSENKIVKKPVGRWDAVMNKISKTETNKTNLKEVKSKVFSGVTGQLQRPGDAIRKVGARQVSTQKSPNVKPRRVRARTAGGSAAASPKSNVESINSSFSDLSATGTTPKNTVGSTKKREVVHVLTASKLSPRPAQPTTPLEAKKSTPTTSLRESKPKRPALTPKEKKAPVVKECGRATAKGGRTSPVVRPPVHTRAPPNPVPRVAEALAVLVQHLVFNVEAYKVPALKREVQKFRQEAEEIRLACQHLEENLAEERTKQAKLIDEERVKFSNEIGELEEKHRNRITELNIQQYELESRLAKENEANRALLAQQNDETLMKLKLEFQKLQKTHGESLDILREENDAIREQIDEKVLEVEEAKYESRKLKEDYEAKEMKLQEQLQHVNRENQKMRQELGKMEEKIKDKIQAIYEENARLREENDRLLGYSGTNGISVQEVQSLRVVLELKQKEVAELRRALTESKQRNDLLAGAEEKAAALNARCEDLNLQLQRKSEYEQNIIAENKKLQDRFKEEINQKRRLSQYNEELQWKLKQNKEVVTKVLEQAEESVFNRTLLSSSFNERHNPNKQNNLERAFSFREQRCVDRPRKSKNDFQNDDLSPPTSPKVKGVVEKSDWVSYVLEMDENPEIVASRIVRRSFRNSTPPKTTPTKSPSNKRPRMKNPLSMSASASAILPSNKAEYARSPSLSVRNGDFEVFTLATSTPLKLGGEIDDSLDLDEDHDVDLKLPALPSEIGRKNGAQALPSPKHLAGEAMISESNSEDESTSSSSVQL